MSSQQNWHDPYSASDHRKLAHIYERPSPWSSPSVVVPLLILAATVICSRISLAALVALAGHWLLEAAARLLPAKPIFAAEAWLRPPTAPGQMLLARTPTHEAKREAIQRILGWSLRGSIVETVSVASKAGISKLFHTRTRRPAGLGNISNSCYQNSILQALAALQPLRDYLTRLNTDTELPQLQVAGQLHRLVNDLHGSQRNGETIWPSPTLKNMSTFSQQDAQEYFSRLLDAMEVELKKAAKAAQKKPAGFEGASDGASDETASSHHSDDSGYQSAILSTKASDKGNSLSIPLEGFTAETITCTVCGSSSGLTMRAFSCLTLSLDSDTREFELVDLLKSYTDTESLTDVHCARCTLLKLRDMLRKLLGNTSHVTDNAVRQTWVQRLETVEAALEDDDSDDDTLTEKCKIQPKQKARTTKTRKMAIGRPPPSLVFHINRSIYHPVTFNTFKNFASVKYPMHLDLGPWCLGSASSPAVDEKAGRTTPAEEQWEFPQDSPIIAGTRQPSRLAGPFYKLRAVVTHLGRHENGHYICYRKHPPQLRDAEPGQEAEKEELETSSPSANEGVESLDGTNRSNEEDEDKTWHWWRLSDGDVRRATDDEVMAQARATENVFMLFYDRVDPNSVLVSDEKDNLPTYEEAMVSGLLREMEATHKVELPAVKIPASRESVISTLDGSEGEDVARRSASVSSTSTLVGSPVKYISPSSLPFSTAGDDNAATTKSHPSTLFGILASGDAPTEPIPKKSSSFTADQSPTVTKSQSAASMFGILESEGIVAAD
jgi:ubiquitin carboxyl-terminal hydrolase 1